MRYVLARPCIHPDHEDEDCDTVAYMYGETEDGRREIMTFDSRDEGLEFMKDNRLSPKYIMLVPYEEAIIP